MIHRNGNLCSVVALGSGGTCWGRDIWELPLLEDLGEMPRPNRKLVHLWALEKMAKQGHHPQGTGSECHRASRGRNGSCQAIADEIYLLEHMGLSLGPSETASWLFQE